MHEPLDHDTELARTGYPLPAAGDLTDGERESLGRYGYWMEGLSRGRLAPKTDDQHHFVAVARGEADPVTLFERAWVKLQLALHHPPTLLSPAEMSSLAMRMEQAREAALAAQLDHAEKRQQILEKVQAELDALDAAEADRLQALEAEFSRLEAQFREAVLLRGLSFSQGRVKASYNPGRVTYDAKALEDYATAHPEVKQYRKVGKAFVALKFQDGDSKAGT